MKYKKYPWPTDGATRKQLDRLEDKQKWRMEDLQKKFQRSFLRLVELETRLRILEINILGEEEE